MNSQDINNSPKQDQQNSNDNKIVIEDIQIENNSKQSPKNPNNNEQAANDKSNDKIQSVINSGKEDEQQGLLNKDEPKKIEIEMEKLKLDKEDKDKDLDDKLEKAMQEQKLDSNVTEVGGRPSVKGKNKNQKEAKDIKGQKTLRPDASGQLINKNENMPKKEVKANVKKNHYEQQKMLEKQFKQRQLEMKKNQGSSQQIQKSGFSLKALLKDNLFLRKCWRIFLLILIVALIVGLILIFYYEAGFIRGKHVFKNNEKVTLEIQSCTLMIYDYKLKDTETLDLGFLGASISAPASLESDENVFMFYTYPDAPAQDNDSTYDSSDENNVNSFQFINKFSDHSCEIALYVYKETLFEQFDINCGDFYQCNIIINSDLFSATKMNIKGQNVQMNAPSLKADTFTYLSMKGSIEMPYFDFKDANIQTREGDISIQSTKDINLELYQKDPFSCLTAKKITDSNGVISQTNYATQFQTLQAEANCKKVFPYGVEDNDQNIDKLIELRCYKGVANLRNKEETPSILSVQNSFGNINVNVISEKGKWAKTTGSNKVSVVFNKIAKDGDAKNNIIDFINLSGQSQINLVNSTKAASNPKVYDPIFVYLFGPKYTRSSTFQQLQLSYNPAYTYMKPYWLGQLTFTLMSTERYIDQYTIAPGFCPYIPSLSLERMHATQNLVSSFMQSNSAPEYSLVSTAWQAYIDKPAAKFSETDTFTGFKDISLNRRYDEQWIGIIEDQSHEINYTNYDVSENGSLFAAIIVSCILSGILGIVFMVILVFAINQNYLWVLNHISSVQKYATLEKGANGEIDESTLDIQKRRFYNDYKEEQQKMEEITKKALQDAGENPEQEEKGFVPKYTITGIAGLFYQLVYLSPPLSAFIDYIVLLFHKAKQNSISEFYKLFFRQKKISELKESDEELHNLEKDSILGSDMKQLYEKFCYLNQYLERKFDDEENLKFLTQKGFKIAARYDAQTQYFTYVKYNGVIPTAVEESNKSSLDQFISTCCSLTKFDTDRIEATILDQIYQDFCTLNHMQKQQLNEGSMKRDYGIQTIYLPQQWVERDEKFDVQKQKKKFFIDKKRVENNFQILLAKDSFLFNILYDTDDYKESQKDIKVPTGWQFFDLVTVVAHILTMTLLGSPLLLLAIFLRTQQSVFSLLPPLRLIFTETIRFYPTSIPAKLIDDNWIVQAITIITIIFWVLSFWDLIYYYACMDFPQEKYFNEYKMVGRFRKFLSGIMWIIVLIALYTTAVYLSLVAIWLMLSAIINPNAFLPYATSAATFVTLVTKKYKEFEEVSQNGFKILSDYLQQLATGQFQELLSKMNIEDKIADAIPTDTLKDITSEASKLGLIDPSTCEDINNNLEVMVRDPKSVSKLGSELVKISQDPAAFAAQLSQKLEDKAKAMIQSQVMSIDKDLREEVVNLFWCLLKGQKNELKSNISSFVNALISVYSKKVDKKQLKNIGFLNLKGPVFDFIWEFAFPQENFKGNYQDHLTNVFCVALSNFITQWNKNLKVLMVDPEQIKKQQPQKENNANNKNKKKGNNKKQIDENSEAQMLREKIQKEMEKAEAIIQADLGQEDEVEVEITSEEAITFAYKNIIFSVIQICRAINSGNSEVILNQILSLVQNTSKLPGFDGLAQVKQYQDVFKLGYAMFKNDGAIAYSDVSAAFKSFLKNTGLESEVKDISGVGILDVLKIVEVIIESFKNQSKPLASSVIKQVIYNLIGSIDFVNKRTMLKNQEFKDVNEMSDVDELAKMKDDVAQNLKETIDEIKDLENQRTKARQNEDSYRDKLENSQYYLRYYCRVLIQEKPDYDQAKLDEIDSASADKIYFELEKVLEETKKNGAEQHRQLIKQKAETMTDFAVLKTEKVQQYEKLSKISEKLDPIREQIKRVLDDKNATLTKNSNERESKLSVHREKIKEKSKQMTSKKYQIESLKIKIKDKEIQKNKASESIKEAQKKIQDLVIKRNNEKNAAADKKSLNSKKSKKNQEIGSQRRQNRSQNKEEEEEEQLLLNKQETENDATNAQVPSEGIINTLFNTVINPRNIYLFEHDDDLLHEEMEMIVQEIDERTEEEKQLAKDIIQYKQQIEDLQHVIEQLNADILAAENEQKQLDTEIQEIQDRIINAIDVEYDKLNEEIVKKFTVKDEEDKLGILQEKYDKEKEIYDTIINKISDNMQQQEDLEEAIKSIQSNSSSYVSDTQIYMDEFKSSQKALNKIQEEKIDIHDKIDALSEKKKKFEEYSTDLEERYKLMLEELQEKKLQEQDKEKKNQKNEAQIKEDNNNSLSSGITIMLSFFTGSISNLPIDLIKEFGQFLNMISKTIDDHSIQSIFQFLSSQICDSDEGQENVAGKKSGKDKDKINQFQSLLNLMEIFMNDTEAAANKINKNGKETCSFDDTVIDSLQTLFTCKYDGLVSLKQINNLVKGSEVLELISKVMKIKEDAVLGLIQLLIGYNQSRDVSNFLNFAATLNKNKESKKYIYLIKQQIKENKIPILMNLYNLYSSVDPSELQRALSFFLINKSLPKNINITDLVQVLLFMRGQLDFQYVKQTIEVKLNLPQDDKKEQNPKIQLEIDERIKYSADLPKNIKKLLQIQIKGYTTASILSSEFKEINNNLEIFLETSDFAFLKKLLSIRNIPRIEDPSQNTIVKSAITDISEMLNIDYLYVEFLVNFLTSSQQNKLMQSLQMLEMDKMFPNIQKKSIPAFVEYSASILEKIQSRNNNITNISKHIYSDSLPQSLLKRILFNENSAISYEDYLSLFQVYCGQIPKSIQNIIDFKFGIGGSKKRNICQFLNPQLKPEEIEKIYPKYKTEQSGLLKAVQLISIDDEVQRIKVFLQYLIKTKQETLLMMSCLLVYFSGRSNNVYLSVSDPSDSKKKKKMTVEQLLCQLLQVKQEFFEAIHTFCQEDTNVCTQTMIKFYRQLDYLDQQSQAQQGIVENNITISDKVVEQYLRLVYNMQLNTSFFSKESKIPIEAVELISSIMQVKKATNEQERSVVFEQMKNNTSISKILQQLGVNLQELASMIKIMYQDYDPTNVKWISKTFKLPSNFKIDGLQQLIMLDQLLPVFGESQQNLNTLVNLIKTNKFVKNFKVNTTWAELAYILVKGDFTLLSKYQDKIAALKYPSSIRYERIFYDTYSYPELKQSRNLTQAVNAKEVRYMDLIQGLTGLLSCRNSTFLTAEFLYQLYTIISQKYYKEAGLTIENGLKKGNTLQYALYKFTKSTLISPIWTLLMMGDFKAWEYITQSYYLENNSKIEYLNPVLALVYVINFRANPLIIKQLLSDLEYAQKSQQVYIAYLKKQSIKRQQQELKKQHNFDEYEEEEHSEMEIEELLKKEIKIKKKDKTNKPQEEVKFEYNDEEKYKLDELEEKIKNFKIQINNILINSIEKDAEKLIHLAEDFNFPKSVIKMLLVYSSQLGAQDKEEEDDDEQSEGEKENRLTNDMIHEAFQPIETQLDKDKVPSEFKELEILNYIFNNIDSEFFVDPRREKYNKTEEEKNFTNKYCNTTLSSSPLMQMVVLSTISQLKGSYNDYYGFTQRDEDHYKQVSFGIDLILNTIEKFYYFDDMMDFFPRHRLIPLIGLSVGFVIETDDILSSMTSDNLFGHNYNDSVILELCRSVYEKQHQDEIQESEELKLGPQSFQKYIELKKFQLKFKYFEENIIEGDILDQLECQYGSSGIFKGISQSEVISELEKKNTERLIDNYDEMMWNTYEDDQILLHLQDSKSYSTYLKRSYYYSKSDYEYYFDSYSGESYKELFTYIDEYSKQAESENFRLLVDLFKENYKSLNNNDQFVTNYGQDSNIYFGMLYLNGLVNQNRADLKMEEFLLSVTSACLYMQSNKKSIAEILSLLVPSLKTSFSSLYEQQNVQEEIMTSFIDLAMGKSLNPSQDLDNLLKKASLSEANKDTLKNTIWAYQGDMSEPLKLIDHSDLFASSESAQFFFSKFIWSFEKSSMHSSSNNSYEINYFDICNLSPNRELALRRAQQYLWRVSSYLSYQKWQTEQKSKLLNKIIGATTLSYEEYKLKHIYKDNALAKDKYMSSLLQKILYNDWSFLIGDEAKIYQQSFDVIFPTKPEDKLFESLNFLALLKPQQCNLQINATNFEDNITHHKVTKIFENGKTEQIKLFENLEEKKSIHLMLSLSNNSIVHILNCLNTNDQDWRYDELQEIESESVDTKLSEFMTQNKYNPDTKDGGIQDIIFKAYNDFKKEIHTNSKTAAYGEDEEFQLTNNKYIAYNLQSLYLWKNISSLNWDTINKNTEAFLENPCLFKSFKEQIDFIIKYVDYLTILPAVIIDKSGLKPNPSKKDARKVQSIKKVGEVHESLINEGTNSYRAIKNMKMRTLNTELLTSNKTKQNNSMYQIFKSCETIFSCTERTIGEYFDLIDEVDEDLIENIEEKISQISPEIYYLLSMLNGSFLKKLAKVHPLIEYLSNLYFCGLEAINTSKPEVITKYLSESIENEDSFMRQILKENKDYAYIFNQVLSIIFSISFSTINDSKIDRLEKENILNQIDSLLDTVGRNLLQVDDNIINLIYAVFYLITNQETKKMKENERLKDKQNCLIILLKIAFENPDLSEFFFGSPKAGEGAVENIDKMINTISSLLQQILDKPSQSINDSDLVKEVLKLVKFASKGTVDVVIVEDIIGIVTGEHQRVFNLLKKFEILDENKILLIQRAYNQVADMPIFNKESRVTGGGSTKEQSDKMKEVVKKLKDGKATIKDVFIAVDAEGDSNGTISIDEFQSFVRRLGMELSRHRVNEIFAYIKNKKMKSTSSEKSEELTLNVDEFDKAFKYVNDKKTSMSLEKLGISPALLALALGTLIVILILLFVFIFLGINAFAIGGTFGSIINSIIPMTAAGGAAGSQEDKKNKLQEEEISGAVSETQAIIHSDHI